jgi:hypothetical protein
VHRDDQGRCDRPARHEARQHQLRRTAEPFDADGHPPLHPTDHAFSKKVENHWYALAIYFMHYNYVRIHTTLRTSPAMAAGVSKTLWSMDDVVKVVEEWEAAQ